MEPTLANMDEKAVRKAYARWAPVYDMTFGKIVDAGRKHAVKQINKLSGDLLEVGVGTGISLSHYKPDLRITGVDLSPEMLDKARERVTRQQLTNVDALLEMDASAMGFDDASFDVVVAMYVLTVVPDPVTVMHELARVCKPGGQVIIINHFSQQHGVRGVVEKKMSRFSETLGWRPEFPVEALMVCDDLELIGTSTLKPLDLFSMLRFKKSS